MVIIILSQLNAGGNKGTIVLKSSAADHVERLSVDSIDRINKRANNTYLSNPVYGRKLAASALVASKLINYKRGIGQGSLYIGITYWAQSYHSISLLYIDTALRYLGKDDNLITSECYRYMGRNYAELKDYSSALYYLTKARQTAGIDKKRSVEALSEISLLYLMQKQYNKAYDTAAQALKICRELNDTRTQAVLYSRFASIYLAQQQYSKALNYNDTGINLSYSTNNKRLRALSFAEKSSILLKLNNNTDALRYANEALTMGDTLGIMDLKTKAYQAIIAVYQSERNADELLKTIKNYTSFLEQKNALDKQSNSSLIRDYFDLNTKLQSIYGIEQQAKQDNIRIRSQQQVIVILIISLLTLGVLLYILWYYYRQKTAFAQQLKEQNIATVMQSQIIENQAKKLEELNSFKSKLLAIIGHDLRAPINNLRNITDMFEDGSFSADEISMLMKTISPVVKGAELTLSNLLVWADGQIRGIKSITASHVNLHNIILETKEICKSELDKKKITITHSVEPNTYILVDVNHLKVILNNLVSNAIKFTEGSGLISLSAELQNDRLIVCVKDTGIGMTGEEIDKLLSVTTHFSKLGTRGEKGTGIGLLLCKELIELNSGKLWISPNVDKGTSFYFSLPAGHSQVA